MTRTPVAGLHLYARPDEPATRYNAGAPVGETFWINHNPRRQMWCHRCGRKRWAARLRVQVYYDLTRVYCADREHCYRTRKRRTKR
jgi:hypothetical protein